MFRAGHTVILVALSLLLLGVVMVNSAGLTIARDDSLSVVDVLTGRTMLLAVVALIALGIGYFVPVARLGALKGAASPIPWIIVVSVGLLIAVQLPGLSREVNHARRWIDLGPLSFQPSEIAKWGLIIAIACYASMHAVNLGRFTRGFVWPMAVVGVICALVAIEDLGTAVLIGLVATFMLIAAGVRPWHVGALAPVGLAGLAAALIHSPYRINRLRAFMDPYGDPEGIGYHMIQSMAAVSAGGLPGRGLGNGVQKFGYLPEDTTDFIFAITCEELGIVGALVVVAAYAALLLALLSILLNSRDVFSRLVTLGVTLTIGFQAVINLFVVTGMGPTKGIALPLVSSGGTGWVLTAFMLGLVAAIDRNNAQHAASVESPAADTNTPGEAPSTLIASA